MDLALISREDVEKVILECEAADKRVYDSDKDVFYCHKEEGNVTFWVEYRINGDEYIILNAFSHRMKIMEK